jgi:regulator of chromosome condensation
MDEQPLGRLWCVGYCTFLQTRPDGTGAGGGLIYACGLNSYGQLGLGDTDDRTVPALVSSLSAPCAPGGGIVAICGGSQHSLALTRDGGVFSWGRGDSGQLGLVASADARGRLPMACGAFTPRQLPPSAFSRAPIVALAANGCSSCALTADGTLFSWGFGESGQLAHGRSADENVPRAVNASASTIITAAAAVGLGGQHIVILAEPRAGLTSKDLAAKECRVIEDPEVPVDDDEDDAGCGDDGRA